MGGPKYSILLGVERAATRLALVGASPYLSRIGRKPPQNMRFPSKGILSGSGCMRLSSMIFGQAAFLGRSASGRSRTSDIVVGVATPDLTSASSYGTGLENEWVHSPAFE